MEKLNTFLMKESEEANTHKNVNKINESIHNGPMINIGTTSTNSHGAQLIIFGKEFSLAVDKNNYFIDNDIIEESIDVAESVGYEVDFVPEDWYDNNDSLKTDKSAKFYLVYEPFKFGTSVGKQKNTATIWGAENITIFK